MESEISNSKSSRWRAKFPSRRDGEQGERRRAQEKRRRPAVPWSSFYSRRLEAVWVRTWNRRSIRAAYGESRRYCVGIWKRSADITETDLQSRNFFFSLKKHNRGYFCRLDSEQIRFGLHPPTWLYILFLSFSLFFI